MDVRRVCRTEKWYFGQGTDTYAIVDWFFAPPGAAVYSEPTPFRSLDFWDGLTALADRPGPVKYQLGTFRKGDTPPGYLLPGMAQSPCGQSAYWLDGIPSPPPPPPPLNPDGIPFCCTSRRTATGTIAGTSSLLGRPPVFTIRQELFGITDFSSTFLGWTNPTIDGSFLLLFVTAADHLALTPTGPITGPSSGGWTMIAEQDRGWIHTQVWICPAATSRSVDGPWTATKVLRWNLYGFECRYVPGFGSVDLNVSAQGDGSIATIGPTATSDYPQEAVFVFGAQYYGATLGIPDGFLFLGSQRIPAFGSEALFQQVYRYNNYLMSLLLQVNPSTLPTHPWLIHLVSLRLIPEATLSYGTISGSSELAAAATAQRRAVAQIAGDSELDGQGTGLAGFAGEVAGDSELDAGGTVPVAAPGEIIGDSELDGIMRVHWGEPGVIAGDSLLDGLSAPIARTVGSIAGNSSLAAAPRSLARAVGAIAGNSTVAAAGRAAVRVPGAIAGDSLLLAVGTVAGISIVQHTRADSGAGNTVDVTWGTPTTPGNLLVAVVSVKKNSINTFTPPAGWTVAAAIAISISNILRIYYVPNAASQASTGTWTASATTSRLNVAVVELHGALAASPLDGNGGTSSSSGTASSGTTGGLAQTGEASIAGFLSQSGVSITPTTSGYNVLENDPGSGTTPGVCLALKLPAGTAAESCSATLGSSSLWGGVINTFKH